MRKRRSFGATENNDSDSLRETTDQSIESAGAADQNLRTNSAFMAKDTRQSIYVSPEQLRKTFNARFIPCSFEEFANITWPSIEHDIKTVDEEHKELLTSASWYSSLSNNDREQFLHFLTGVRTKAISMHNEVQIHPITLERAHALSDELFVVDGERRCMAMIYSNGLIPLIKANVYNALLDDYTRAKIKDDANTSIKLTTYETILSKKAIFDALPSQDISVRKLAKELGYSTSSIPSLLKKLFHHKERDRLLQLLRTKNLGYRELENLLKETPAMLTKATATPSATNAGRSSIRFATRSSSEKNAMERLVKIIANSSELSIPERKMIEMSKESSSQQLKTLWDYLQKDAVLR